MLKFYLALSMSSASFPMQWLKKQTVRLGWFWDRRVLSVQSWGPEFRSSALAKKKLGVVLCDCNPNPSARGEKTGGSRSLSESSWIIKLHCQWQTSPQNSKVERNEDTWSLPGASLWALRCAHTYKCAHRHTTKRKNKEGLKSNKTSQIPTFLYICSLPQCCLSCWYFVNLNVLCPSFQRDPFSEFPCYAFQSHRCLCPSGFQSVPTAYHFHPSVALEV